MGRRRRIRGKRRKRTKRQRGGSFDVQKALSVFGKELHVPGYQFLGPGTKLKERLKRGDMGINRLDRLARTHDLDYSRSKNLQDKWKADTKMINAINSLPGKKTKMEHVVKNVLRIKKAIRM